MGKVVKRQVYYFDEPGEENTSLVIEAVSQRLEAGGTKKVIVVICFLLVAMVSDVAIADWSGMTIDI